jgi:hypothetical protein
MLCSTEGQLPRCGFSSCTLYTTLDADIQIKTIRCPKDQLFLLITEGL